MISNFLILPILASFFITLILLPFWIKRAQREGLVGKDIHKLNKVKVAEGGGLVVVVGFVLGVLFYVALKTFYFSTSEKVAEIFALLTTLLIVVMIGTIDTFLGWRRGLGRRLRTFLVLFSAIPLIVINAGRSVIEIPFFGVVDLGILYPLVLIPIGVAGATTVYNFLAGYNGLEAGQGVIFLLALSAVAYFTGSPWLSIISLCMIAALLAFLVYNLYPARVFPGDALTYGIGGLIAVMAILGNFERIAVFFFIPYIIEFFLKARGNFVKQSFGKLMPDGSLDLRYSKIYGLEHLAIYIMKKLNIKPTEKKVVYSIWLFQLVIIALGFIIFRNGIFK